MTPGYKKTFYLVFMLNFFYFVSLNSQAMFPVYFDQLGAGKTWIGIFLNINSVALIIYVFLFNRKTVHLNKKRTLFAANLAACISELLMFFFSSSLSILLVLKVFSTLSFVFSFTMHTSIIYQAAPENKKTIHLAWLGISGILSNPVGALITEYFIKNFPIEYIFLIPAFFNALNLVPLLFLKLDSEFASDKTAGLNPENLKDTSVLKLIPLTLFLGALLGVFRTYIPQFSLERIGDANLSLFFTAFSVISLFIRGFVFRFFSSMNKVYLFPLTILSALAAAVLIRFHVNFFFLFSAGLFYGFTHSILFPVLAAAFAESSFKGSRDEKINLFLSLNTAGIVGAAALAGAAADFFGLTPVFSFMIILCLTMLFVYRKP